MSGQTGVQAQAADKPTLTPTATGVLQRQCSCGQHTSAGGECEECKKKRGGLPQRAATTPSPVHDVPPIVHEVLRSPGQPLDSLTRAFMEPRFGHDFSSVQAHDVNAANVPARLAVNAGRDAFEQEADAVAERLADMSVPLTHDRFDFGGVRIHADAPGNRQAPIVSHRLV